MFDYIAAHYQDIAAILGAVVTAATIITRLTPTTKDDALLSKVIRVFSLVSKRGSFTE